MECCDKDDKGGRGQGQGGELLWGWLYRTAPYPCPIHEQLQEGLHKYFCDCACHAADITGSLCLAETYE